MPESIRRAIAKEPGDMVQVRLGLDRSDRTVELDSDTEEQLRSAHVLEKFRALSYSHQREFARWIGSAEKGITRAGRRAKLVIILSES